MGKPLSSSVWSWICLVLFVLTILILRENSLSADGALNVHILDVGQGDSILLVTPSGKQILVDGGPDLSTLEHLGKYFPYLDRKIELLVMTHPDADHLTALPAVLERYDIDQVMISGIDKSQPRYQAMLDLITEREISVIFPDPTKDVLMGDGVVLDVVAPKAGTLGEKVKDANNSSVVLRVLYGEDSLLLTGDIEEEAEYEILASGADLHSRILKAAHHGSKTSSATGFLLATHPELVLISSGSGNSFGHPHAEVIERYARYGIPYRNTALEGTISLRMTGTPAPANAGLRGASPYN